MVNKFDQDEFWHLSAEGEGVQDPSTPLLDKANPSLNFWDMLFFRGRINDDSGDELLETLKFIVH